MDKPRFQAFHTPANAKRRIAATNQISSVGLLQQKAAELQQFHSTRRPMHHTLYPVNDECMRNQYDERINEPDHFLDPDMTTQRSFFHQHMGLSAGSVMQQSVCMTQESSRTPPPPPFMGHNTTSSIAPIRGSYFHHQRRAPTGNNMMQHSFGMSQPSHARSHKSSVTRPVSSSGQSISSRLRENSFGTTNYQACMPPIYHCPAQSVHNYQSKYDQQLYMQSCEENITGFQHGMTQPHFEDTFNDPLCLGLDPTYGNATGTYYELPAVNMSGGRITHDHSFGGYIDGTNADMFHDRSFGNMSVDVTQFGDGRATLHNPSQHFAPQQQKTGHVTLHNPYHHTVPQQQAAGYATLHNPYHHSVHRQQTVRNATLQNPYQHSVPQQQTAFTSNPYNKNLQQPQNFHSCDNPPMQEVVVQNSSVRSGLGGDDTSQFDDAFL